MCAYFPRVERYLLHRPGFVGEHARSVHALVSSTTMAHFKQEASKAWNQTWKNDFQFTAAVIACGTAFAQALAEGGLRYPNHQIGQPEDMVHAIYLLTSAIYVGYRILYAETNAYRVAHSTYPEGRYLGEAFVVGGPVGTVAVIGLALIVPRPYFLGCSLLLFVLDRLIHMQRGKPFFSRSTHVGLNCAALGHLLHPRGATWGLIFSLPLQATVRLIENLMASAPFTTCKSRLDLAIKAVEHAKKA